MTDDFSTQLRDRLHRAAADVTLTGPGPEAAISRARARHRNRRAVGAGLGAVLLAGTVLTTVGDDDGDRASLATQTDLPAGEPVELEWLLAEDGVSNVRSSVIDSTSGATYALSTAPGLRATAEEPLPAAHTLYRLAEGGQWEAVAVDDPDTPARLAADGGALYAIGTSARDRGAIATVVRTSADGGETWSEDVLGETAAPNDTLPWLRIDRLGIAAASGQRVAITTSAFSVDWNAFAGNQGNDDSYVRGVVEADGIRLIRDTFSDEEPGPSGADRDDPATLESTEEEIGFETWDDLDLPGPEVFEERTAVHVHDGEQWIESPADLTDQHLTSLQSVNGRFVLRTFEQTSPATGEGVDRTFTSGDGHDWTEVQAPGAYQVVPVGAGFAGISDDFSGLVHSVGEGQWTTVDLPSIDERLEGGTIGMFNAGDLGLAFTTHAGDSDEPSYLVFTPDLRSWTVEPLADVFGDGPTYPSMLEVGPDRIVIVGTELGGGGDGPGGNPDRTVTAVGVPRS